MQCQTMLLYLLERSVVYVMSTQKQIIYSLLPQNLARLGVFTSQTKSYISAVHTGVSAYMDGTPLLYVDLTGTSLTLNPQYQ